MKHKIIAKVTGVIIIGLSLLMMSGCVDDVTDGIDKANNFLKANKESIESGLAELQEGIDALGEQVDDYIKDSSKIRSTESGQQTYFFTAAQEPTPETTKGMKY